jgi:hypothetical protein
MLPLWRIKRYLYPAISFQQSAFSDRYWYRLTGSIGVPPVRRTLRTGQRPMLPTGQRPMLPLWRIKRYQYPSQLRGVS